MGTSRDGVPLMMWRQHGVEETVLQRHIQKEKRAKGQLRVDGT